MLYRQEKYIVVICGMSFLHLALMPVGVAAAPSEHNKQVVISSLPDNIKLIVGEGDQQFYNPRVKAIHALPNDLSDDQIEVCYEFLYKKIETQKLPNLEFNGLKNELVFALMRQKKKPSELSSHLVKIYRDKSFDTTWRDYCVQFFGKWYPGAPDNQGRKEMVAGLWDALDERHNSIAGAASSQLAWLARKYPEVISPTKVSQKCLEALRDKDCNDISMVSLLQACAVLNSQDVLPVACTIVEQKKNAMLRISAIGTIGSVGNEQNLPLLKKCANENDMRIKKVALEAMKKIEERHKLN